MLRLRAASFQPIVSCRCSDRTPGDSPGNAGNSGPAGKLLREPGVHALLQDVERQGAGAEQGVMEVPHVEIVAERRLRVRT